MIHALKRTWIAVAAISLLGAACAKKKVAVAPPPAPPTAASPAATSKPTPPPMSTATTQPPAATAPAERYPNAATPARIDALLAKIETAYFHYHTAPLPPPPVKPP